MLKGINKLLTGDVLKIICDMGHGDELVIADANFPAETCAQRLIRIPGASATDVLKAILPLFPVDWFYTEKPAIVMERTKEDSGKPEPDAWREFRDQLGRDVSPIERFEFYERSKKAYAVIQTGEERQYGNLILVKGVVEL